MLTTYEATLTDNYIIWLNDKPTNLDRGFPISVYVTVLDEQSITTKHDTDYTLRSSEQTTEEMVQRFDKFQAQRLTDPVAYIKEDIVSVYDGADW